MRPPGQVDHRFSATARATGRSAERIGVLLAMSHRMDRDLLASYLASCAGFVVVARAGTRAELEAAAHGPMPDVVLLGLTGPMAANRLRVIDVRRFFPEVPVLVTAPHDVNECPILRLTQHRAETGHVGAVSPVPDCLAVAVMQGAHGAIRRRAATSLLRLPCLVDYSCNTSQSATTFVLALRSRALSASSTAAYALRLRQ